MQEDIVGYNLYCAGIHTELGQPLFYRRKASLMKPVFLPPWYLGCPRCFTCLHPPHLSTSILQIQLMWQPHTPCANPYDIQFQIFIQKWYLHTKTQKWSRVIVKHPKWTTEPTIQWFPFCVEDMLRDQLPLDGSVWLLTLEPLVDKFAFLRVPWINIKPRGGEKIWRWKILYIYMWWLMHVAIYIYAHVSISMILHINTSRWFNDSMRFADGRSSEFGSSVLKGHTFHS